MPVWGDFNHDGKIDAAPHNGSGFLIAPLTSLRGEPAAKTPPHLRLPATVAGGRVGLTTSVPDLMARLRPFVRVDGGWRPLGQSDLHLWLHPDLVGRVSGTVELLITVAPGRSGSHRRFDLQIVTDGNTPGEDFKVDVLATIPCQAAPALLVSSLDPVEEVWAVRNGLTGAFCERLSSVVAKAAGRPTLHFVDYDRPPSDVWMQDAIEVCRAPVPGMSRQPVVPLLGLRGKHDMGLDCAGLDAAVAAAWRARPDTVPVQPGEPRGGARWIDWYGNLEVSPPVPDFPQGRLLTGDQKGLRIHPDLLGFLEAQGVQWPPLFLDVGWLTIGHVDELINFVPARDGKGYRALLPSPALARQVLEAAAKAGHANVPVFGGKKGEMTVTRLLEEVALSAETRRIEEALRDTRARLRDGLHLTDADIAEMPVLFKDGLAVVPNGVNSLVLGRDVIIPDPCGPRVGQVDVFQRAIRDRLTPLGLRLHFIDIWEPYHVRAGEIHCGTNAVRRLRNPRWWQGSEP